MQSDDEIIAVVSAHKEGKKIQYKWLDTSGADWEDVLVTHLGFDFRHCIYRIAPEPPKPREFWLIRLFPEYDNDVTFNAYPCYQKGFEGEQIHVMEVIGAPSGNPAVDSDSGSFIP